MALTISLCVISGRRQFVLFPPELITKSLLKPLDFAPTPSPISMVNLREPDFNRYPNYTHRTRTRTNRDFRTWRRDLYLPESVVASC